MAVVAEEVPVRFEERRFAVGAESVQDGEDLFSGVGGEAVAG